MDGLALKHQNKRKRLARRKILYERPANQNRTEDGTLIIDMDKIRLEAEKGAYAKTRDARKERYQVDEKFAASQECGHSIGRLAKQLKWDSETAMRRIGAGFRFAEIVTEYNKDILGAPNPNPRAMDMNKIGGLSTREMTAEHIRTLTSNYMRLIGALEMASLGGIGKMQLFRILSLACVEDADTDNWGDRQVGALILGLDSIAAAI